MIRECVSIHSRCSMFVISLNWEPRRRWLFPCVVCAFKFEPGSAFDPDRSLTVPSLQRISCFCGDPSSSSSSLASLAAWLSAAGRPLLQALIWFLLERRDWLLLGDSCCLSSSPYRSECGVGLKRFVLYIRRLLCVTITCPDKRPLISCHGRVGLVDMCQ